MAAEPVTAQSAANSRDLTSSRTAFVSGGSKGIGLEVVKALLAANYAVVTCARNKAAWDLAVETDPLLGSVDFQAVDLSNQDALDSLFAYIAAKYPKLDVAVNNASPKVASTGRFEQVAANALFDTLLGDLWVPALCMKHELALMSGAGAIVNIGSVNGLRPTPGAAMYSAAKHGLEGLTRSVALEAIEKGVRVNAVAPGATWTPRWQARIEEGSSGKQQVEDAIPLKRFATPGEIAAAVLWLASAEASYVVGHTLVVDGGLSLK